MKNSKVIKSYKGMIRIHWVLVHMWFLVFHLCSSIVQLIFFMYHHCMSRYKSPQGILNYKYFTPCLCFFHSNVFNIKVGAKFGTGVCMCVFISYHHKGFSWLNKTINVIQRSGQRYCAEEMIMCQVPSFPRHRQL